MDKLIQRVHTDFDFRSHMVAPSRQHDTRVNVSFGGIRVVGVVASDSLILQL